MVRSTLSSDYLLGHCGAKEFFIGSSSRPANKLAHPESRESACGWTPQDLITLRCEVVHMRIMLIPGFTAQESLRLSSGRYFAHGTRNSLEFGFVEAQTVPVMRKGNCWCDEPDTRTVCIGPVCHEVGVCLQWSCPGGGLDDVPGGSTVNYPTGHH